MPEFAMQTAFIGGSRNAKWFRIFAGGFNAEMETRRKKSQRRGGVAGKRRLVVARRIFSRDNRLPNPSNQNMNIITQFANRTTRYFAFVFVLCAMGTVRATAGNCAVSDGSLLPSEAGCKLAFVYNQEGDHRLVVLDEKNRRRYEAPLDEAKMAPFWEDEKVYVLDVSGSLQEFSISANKLIPGKKENICPAVVRESAYVRSQHRLFVIRTIFDSQRNISYELSAIDFPTRKNLWTKRIDDPGLINVMDQYVCVMGLKLAEVYNSETGEKIGGIAAAKATAVAHAKH